MAAHKLYNGRDPRDLPAYTVGEAARYLRMPPATLRSWVAGRRYPRGSGLASFEPLIRLADPEASRLSFTNLVEAHVLHALRTHHAVPIRHIRPAIEYAERELTISRLLLSKELHTHAGELFLDYLGHLINLSRSGQLAVRKLLEAHLQRVERDTASLPIRLYPFLTAPVVDGPKNIVIDPGVAFGRPTLSGHGVTTRMLAQRIDAGESPEELAEDYGIGRELIEEAALFEQAA